MVDLCLYVTLPFNILNSFFVDWKWEMLISCSVILLLSVGYNAVSVFLSSVLFKKAPQDRKKTLRYGTIVSNGGFLGNPIIEGVYGTSGLFYASIFMIPVRIVMWSVGISVFLKGKRENILKKGADASVYYRSLCRRNTNGNRSCIAGVSDENYFGVKQLQYTA